MHIAYIYIYLHIIICYLHILSTKTRGRFCSFPKYSSLKNHRSVPLYPCLYFSIQYNMLMLLKKETQIGILIFAVVALVYFFSARGNIEITDTSPSIQTAEAIINNHSLAIPNCRLGHCFRSPKDAKLYSRSGLGLALIFIPYTIASKLLAAITGIGLNQLTNLLISFYNIFFGAGACVIMFYLMKFFKNSNKNSLIMALLLGFATYCWRYSIWDFSEGTQMFFLLLSIYLIFRNTPKSLALGGLFFCCLLLLKILYIICLPVFILYILAKNKETAKDALKRAGIFLALALAGFGIILLLNYIRFGRIFEFGYGLEADKFYLTGVFQHFAQLTYWQDKGIFIYNPLFILGIMGYYQLFKLAKKETVFLFSLILINFLLTSFWYGWHGNWSWGPRYLVPTAPLWLIPVFIFLSQKGIRRFILISLITISILIQVLSVLAGNLEYLTLCNANNQEGLRKGMPAQITGSLILLKHKIIKKNNLYTLAEFEVDSESQIDTSEFGYKKVFDLWYLK